MKGREFFSSASFKSIVVLILIAVVLGGALSILNDVLYVSAEEEGKPRNQKDLRQRNRLGGKGA